MALMRAKQSAAVYLSHDQCAVQTLHATYTSPCLVFSVLVKTTHTHGQNCELRTRKLALCTGIVSQYGIHKRAQPYCAHVNDAYYCL